MSFSAPPLLGRPVWIAKIIANTWECHISLEQHNIFILPLPRSVRFLYALFYIHFIICLPCTAVVSASMCCVSVCVMRKKFANYAGNASRLDIAAIWNGKAKRNRIPNRMRFEKAWPSWSGFPALGKTTFLISQIHFPSNSLNAIESMFSYSTNIIITIIF